MNYYRSNGFHKLNQNYHACHNRYRADSSREHYLNILRCLADFSDTIELRCVAHLYYWLDDALEVSSRKPKGTKGCTIQ